MINESLQCCPLSVKKFNADYAARASALLVACLHAALIRIKLCVGITADGPLLSVSWLLGQVLLRLQGLLPLLCRLLLSCRQ